MRAPIALPAVEAEDILDAPRTTQHASFPLEPANKRNGKIAKLPRTLRDQINHALDLGQSAVSIAQHLNKMPQVKTMLDAHFGGKPISQQNLSEWKAGGYRDWQLRQELILQHEEFTTDIRELGQTAEGMTDAIFGILMFDYARLLKSKDKETPEAFEKKRKALSLLGEDIVRLRRCEIQSRNVEVQEGRLERDREKTSEEEFQKFMEWAGNPAVRRAFILAHEARLAAQRKHFGLPPRPQDEAVLAEYEADTNPPEPQENEPNQTEQRPSQTEKSSPCVSGEDDALAKVGRDTPCPPSSPSPASEDVAINLPIKKESPTASPLLGESTSVGYCTTDNSGKLINTG